MVLAYFTLFKDEPYDGEIYISNLPRKFTQSRYFKEYELHNKFVICVDFNRPRTKRRMWVVDEGKVIATTYTAHGGKSASLSRFLAPNKFSNKVGSKKSSLGIYRIFSQRKMNPPMAKHKCSCQKFISSKKCSHAGKKFPLLGLEKSNNNSLDRGIVIHTAKYVSEKGCIGNSDGCFVVSPKIFELLQSKKFSYFKKSYLLALK